MWIALAQFGMSLFQARMNNQAAGAESALGIAEARLSGTLERRSIRRSAQEEARARRIALAQSLGAQGAALGGAGVIGGRTARLLEAQSQLGYRQAQDASDFNTRQGVFGSEVRQTLGISGFRARAAQARTQSNLDLLGSAIQFGSEVRANRGRPSA